MGKHVLLLLVIGAVAGCDTTPDGPAFDGQYFRAKAKKLDGARENFTVTIRPVSASVAGAQEAGRFEGNKYCVQNYGSSAIIWTVGPDDDPSTYVVENDTLTFQGTCEG